MKLYAFLFISIFFITCGFSQHKNNWIEKFDSNFYGSNADYTFNYERYLKYSKSQDGIKFIPFSYGVNALNIMYKTTGDIKYLESNKKLIDNLISTAIPLPLSWEEDENKKYKGWVVKREAPKHVIGKDWQLYEGYIYRYVAQYLYILKEKGVINAYPEIFREHYQKALEFLENQVWNKWEERSLLKNGNMASFYTNRTHMGSHWAVIALYLSKLSNKNSSKAKKYEKIYKTYDLLLRNNFKIKEAINGEKYYTWHSTYDSIQNKDFLNKKIHISIPSKWQDVSHGNQVVDYIITAYELKNPNWILADLKYLANTVKYLTWDPKRSSFIDNFRGKGIEPELTDIGWKQSDGWLKLAFYDSDLISIYDNFYKTRYKRIDRSFLSIQFWAQFALNFENKR